MLLLQVVDWNKACFELFCGSICELCFVLSRRKNVLDCLDARGKTFLCLRPNTWWFIAATGEQYLDEAKRDATPSIFNVGKALHGIIWYVNITSSCVLNYTITAIIQCVIIYTKKAAGAGKDYTLFWEYVLLRRNPFSPLVCASRN